MKIRNILSTIILVLVLTLTVGFSAFVSEMSISNLVADVRIEKDVRITGVRFSSEDSTDVVVNSLDYDHDSIMSNVTATSDYATLICYVTITNFGNAKSAIYNITSSAGYPGDQSWWYGLEICDGDKCTLGASIEIMIPVYELVGTADVNIDFDIRQTHSITYKNVYNNTLPIQMLSGDMYSNYLGDSYPSLINVYSNGILISPDTYYYEGGYLAGITVNGDIVIEGIYEYTYDYTGNYQTFVVPITGIYKVELWGASSYSNGGYVAGEIELNRETNLYIYVGQMGVNDLNNPKIFNGGGGATVNESHIGDSGSGATDIRLASGEWDDFESLKSRIIVAGGGSSGGYGGGLVGGSLDSSTWEYPYVGHGGTQIAGGSEPLMFTADIPNNQGGAGGFGFGGFGGAGSQISGGSGGGGGYYGGSGASGCHGGWWPAGGGSSFISGHNGCDAIDEESVENNIIHTGQSVHYSGYKFTNTVMISGDGYNWTNEKGEYIGMPSITGSVVNGNYGNGYVKITLIEIK